MNATESKQTYRVTADGLPGLQQVGPATLTLGPAEAHWMAVALRVPPKTAANTAPGAHEIHFVIEREATPSDPVRSIREKSTFLVPR